MYQVQRASEITDDDDLVVVGRGRAGHDVSQKFEFRIQFDDVGIDKVINLPPDPHLLSFSQLESFLLDILSFVLSAELHQSIKQLCAEICVTGGD